MQTSYIYDLSDVLASMITSGLSGFWNDERLI